MSRRLRPEEIDLWRRVAERTDRMHRDRPQPHPAPPPKLPKKAAPAADPEPFRVGQKTQTAAPPHDLMSPIGDRVAAAPLRMDRKTFGRIRKGKMAPEGRIDLHGMTVDRAHPALMSFILRAAADGKRLVLVITGKGRRSDDPGPIPVRQGVLRHQVPHWLQTPPLAQHVLQISTAHQKHGGGGAYYVYLRRPR